MSHFLDLGQRLFSSLKSDLTLSLQASASILLPPERQFSLATERLEELLHSGGIWVSQASELKFDVHIVAEFEVNSSVACFVSHLGDTICKAKMWSDLGLAVLYKSCIFEPEATPSAYTLSFGIQKHVGASVRPGTPKRHRILKDIADAFPPTDISTARITSIDVCLEYHGTHEDQTESPPKHLHYTRGNNVAPVELDHDNPDKTLYALENASPTSSESGDLLLDCDLEEMAEEWQPSGEAVSASLLVSDLEVLFQDALTTLVLGYSTRRRNRHQSRRDGFQSLSSIAPSVFKPGYREAMNQRSRLMPSIAKSLTSMLRHSDNLALEDKLASTRSLHNPVPSFTTPQLDENETKAVLKTRLWTIAQRHLYHAPTPKHLKPSASWFRDPVQNEQARKEEQVQDENLLPETATVDEDEDDLIAFDHEPLESCLYLEPDEYELGLEQEFSYMGMEDDANSMILEDMPLEHPAEPAGDEHSPPLSIQGSNMLSPDSHALLLAISDYAESDDEMLDQGSDPVEELLYTASQSRSQSQASFSQELDLYAEPPTLTSSCENDILTSQTTFPNTLSLHIQPLIHEDGDGDWNEHELICED